MPLADLRSISDVFGDDFYASVTLDAVLDCHDVIGGTARKQVAEAVTAMERRVEQSRASAGDAAGLRRIEAVDVRA